MDSFYTWQTGWKWKCKSYTYEHVSHKENYFRWWIFFAWLWGVCDSILYVGLWPKGITPLREEISNPRKISFMRNYCFLLPIVFHVLLNWCNSYIVIFLKQVEFRYLITGFFKNIWQNYKGKCGMQNKTKKYKGIFEKHIGCLTKS